MKIAFISYEYPPDTGFGGIGTYTKHMVQALSGMGHYIEIFSCSHKEEKFDIAIAENVKLHRVVALRRKEFSVAIVPVFQKRNAIINFDIIESPEYGAEGLPLRNAFPGIPMVVKLHTPNFMVKQLNAKYTPQSLRKKIRKFLSLESYNKLLDPDYQLVVSADAVCSPSRALADYLTRKWGLKLIDVIPSVYLPGPAYLQLPVSPATDKVITYIGRLDVRKGLKSLVDTIPLVLKQKPSTQFRFIGGDGIAPDGKGSMQDYILSQLSLYRTNLEFTGYVRTQEIPSYLKDTGIVILPSIWENFPFVCLEAMSAGKALVVSSRGGMKELITDSVGGFVVNPFRPRKIAKVLIWLLENPDQRIAMGMYNKEKMLHEYEKVVGQHEAYMLSTIEMHRSKYGRRSYRTIAG